MSNTNPLVDHLAVRGYRAGGVSTDDLTSFIESFASLRASRVRGVGADQYALAKGQKLSDAAWERLVRESHEGISKKADQFYANKMKAQLDKGKQGKDIGAGGVTPGQAPRKPRNFDEAREQMLEHLKAR